MLRNIWKGFVSMASNGTAKKAKVIIGTHSGVFHCDEVLACFMLKQLPHYKDAEIIRTRDPNVLSTCDIVVDVGGVYDPTKHRYDHHQRGFDHTISTVRPDIAKDRNIKLSSAGLVYAHFGFEVIKEILATEDCIYTPEDLERIYMSIYDGFIEEIDAIDNGVPMYDEGFPRYRIDTHLSARVHNINPEWNNVKTTSINVLFEKAMKMVGEEFLSKLIQVATVWFPARVIVKKAIENRKSVHTSGKIIELTERVPWKQHLLDLEEEMNIQGEIKFAIFHENLNDTWRVQGIPIQPDSFICRVFLHKDWHGVRDEKLSEVAGIPKCVFCHATGFIGGNQHREGALEMALKSLEAHEQNKF